MKKVLLLLDELGMNVFMYCFYYDENEIVEENEKDLVG